jgi:hypothetical protein
VDQEMNVIGHDDVAHGHKSIARADFLEHGEEEVTPLRAGQPGLPMITTASDEMQLFGAVVASGMVGHQASLLVVAKQSCDIPTSTVPTFTKNVKVGQPPLPLSELDRTVANPIVRSLATIFMLRCDRDIGHADLVTTVVLQYRSHHVRRFALEFSS